MPVSPQYAYTTQKWNPSRYRHLEPPIIMQPMFIVYCKNDSRLIAGCSLFFIALFLNSFLRLPRSAMHHGYSVYLLVSAHAAHSKSGVVCWEYKQIHPLYFTLHFRITKVSEGEIYIQFNQQLLITESVLTAHKTNSSVSRTAIRPYTKTYFCVYICQKEY